MSTNQILINNLPAFQNYTSTLLYPKAIQNVHQLFEKGKKNVKGKYEFQQLKWSLPHTHTHTYTVSDACWKTAAAPWPAVKGVRPYGLLRVEHVHGLGAGRCVTQEVDLLWCRDKWLKERQIRKNVESLFLCFSQASQKQMQVNWGWWW